MFDNALLQVAHTVVDFLKAHGIKIAPHSLYSPDLVPCDSWLFLEVKFMLSGWKFKTNVEVVKAVEVRCKELQNNGLVLCLKCGRSGQKKY